MIAMELSGIHVAHEVEINYRFKTWKVDKPNKIVRGTLAEVEHKFNGTVYALIAGRTHMIPFDAEVELLD
jgi:hypothetical protein